MADDEYPRSVAARRAAVGALLLASAALLARFLLIGRSSFSYDEATYVELARHPWVSSFYPDPVFLRHPPLYFFGMGAWSAIVGSSEAVVRLPSLFASAAGVALTWDAVRRSAGGRAAAVVGLALAVSFLALVYGLQATMYPFAFALIAAGAWAGVTGRRRLERGAVAVIPLVHLFGFLVAVVWIWRQKPRRRADVLLLLPGSLWLVAAGASAFLDHAAAGPSLGPAWQALRIFAVVYESFAQPGGLVTHALAALLALLMLSPFFLWRAWQERRAGSAWTTTGLSLVGAILLGPGFLRYALLALPLVLLSGSSRANDGRWAALAVSVAALSLVAGAAYVGGDVDLRAGNDVPGQVDWRSVADHVAEHPNGTVVAPAPTALAYYLARLHGANITDASQGPARIVLRLGAHVVTVHEPPGRGGLVDAGRDGSLLVVPRSWSRERSQLASAGFKGCGSVDGALLLRAPIAAC